MKKKFILFLLCLFATGALSFAEPLKQFYGVDFGTDMETTIRAMEKKGWSYKLLKTVNGESKVTMYTRSATYAGSHPNLMTLYFYNDRFYAVEMNYPILNTVDHDTEINVINKIRDSFVEKYGCSVTESPDKWTSCYETENGCAFTFVAKEHVRNRRTFTFKVVYEPIFKSIQNMIDDIIQTEI